MPNFAIIITDGISNLNSERTIPEAILTHAAGVHVYVIGIGLTGETLEIKVSPDSGLESTPPGLEAHPYRTRIGALGPN